MHYKILGIFAAVFLLAACETPVEDKAGASGTGGASTGGTTGSASSGATGPSEGAAPGGTSRSASGPAKGSQGDLLMSAGDLIHFDFDKSDLKPHARSVLEAQAAWLKKNAAVDVTIEGHADERGTEDYNFALGERRANAAKTYLVALGISTSRIKITSYGKSRPVALGSNEAAWAQNRRAVTKVRAAGS